LHCSIGGNSHAVSACQINSHLMERIAVASSVRWPSSNLLDGRTGATSRKFGQIHPAAHKRDAATPGANTGETRKPLTALTERQPNGLA
jgi:hypothetical protein